MRARGCSGAGDASRREPYNLAAFKTVTQHDYLHRRAMRCRAHMYIHTYNARRTAGTLYDYYRSKMATVYKMNDGWECVYVRWRMRRAINEQPIEWELVLRNEPDPAGRPIDRFVSNTPAIAGIGERCSGPRLLRDQSPLPVSPVAMATGDFPRASRDARGIISPHTSVQCEHDRGGS